MPRYYCTFFLKVNRYSTRWLFQKILVLLLLIPSLLFFYCSSQKQVTENSAQNLLWQAVLENNPQKAKEALLQKADPNATNKERKNPAMVAAEKGHKEVLLVLLSPKEDFATETEKQKKRIAFPVFINKTGKKEFDWIAHSLPDALEGSLSEVFSFERTPEPKTAQKSSEMIAKHKDFTPAMLKSLADATKADFIVTGNYQIFEYKLSIEIFVFSTTAQKKILEITANSKLDASLFDAIELASRNMVTVMQEKATMKAGALYQAIRLKSEPPELLTDLSQEDRRGNTIVSLAAQNRHRNILSLLFAKGADFQAELIKAINFRETEIARELIAVMPEVDFRFSGGKTPLHQAAYKGLLLVIIALIERKVSIDALDMYGFTALLYAAQEGHLEVVKFLIQQGANPRHTDYLGLTVLEAAKRRQHSAVVNYLQSILK